MTESLESKRISVVTACYDEEENVEELYRQVRAVFLGLPGYRYEHIFIDNASKDRTVEILTGIAKNDPNVTIIVNTRNFGHIRSPFHGLMQATGDAVVNIVADLQDPPAMIADFVRKWEDGYKIVIGVKTKSEEPAMIFSIRKLYYSLIGSLSDVDLIKNFTGFGLYDKNVIDTLRTVHDSYPYLRGLICEVGFDRAVIEYVQPSRKRGRTKNNFYTLYDMAMLGITNHSKIPLRLATIAIVSLLVAAGYFLYKLVFWNKFQVGIAPLVIGLFFFSAVQLFFVGVIGEYVGAIHTQVLRRFLVVEKERIHFDQAESVRELKDRGSGPLI